MVNFQPLIDALNAKPDLTLAEGISEMLNRLQAFLNGTQAIIAQYSQAYSEVALLQYSDSGAPEDVTDQFPERLAIPLGQLLNPRLQSLYEKLKIILDNMPTVQSQPIRSVAFSNQGLNAFNCAVTGSVKNPVIPHIYMTETTLGQRSIRFRRTQYMNYPNYTNAFTQVDVTYKDVGNKLFPLQNNYVRLMSINGLSTGLGLYLRSLNVTYLIIIDQITQKVYIYQLDDDGKGPKDEIYVTQSQLIALENFQSLKLIVDSDNLCEFQVSSSMAVTYKINAEAATGEAYWDLGNLQDIITYVNNIKSQYEALM